MLTHENRPHTAVGFSFAFFMLCYPSILVAPVLSISNSEVSMLNMVMVKPDGQDVVAWIKASKSHRPAAGEFRIIGTDVVRGGMWIESPPSGDFTSPELALAYLAQIRRQEGVGWCIFNDGGDCVGRVAWHAPV